MHHLRIGSYRRSATCGETSDGVLWCLNRGKGEMPAGDYLEVCRLVADHKAEAVEPYGVAPGEVGEGEGRGASDSPQSERYTIRQIAAFRAHITMLRGALGGLSGTARSRAPEELGRQEARLAAALSGHQG